MRLQSFILSAFIMGLSCGTQELRNICTLPHGKTEPIPAFFTQKSQRLEKNIEEAIHSLENVFQKGVSAEQNYFSWGQGDSASSTEIDLFGLGEERQNWVYTPLMFYGFTKNGNDLYQCISHTRYREVRCERATIIWYHGMAQTGLIRNKELLIQIIAGNAEKMYLASDGRGVNYIRDTDSGCLLREGSDKDPMYTCEQQECDTSVLRLYHRIAHGLIPFHR